MMIIKYSKNLQRRNLILGMIFLVLGALSAGMEPWNPMGYFPFLYGFFLLANFFFLKKTDYFRIDGDVMTTWYNFRKKEIYLSEITRIKKFAGDITLFTSETKISLNKDAIDKASLPDFNRFIASLEIEVEENPKIPAKKSL